MTRNAAPGFLPLFCLVLSLGGCTASDDDTSPTPEPCENETEPELLVQPVEDGQNAGFPVPVLAQVSDPEGIGTVTLYYRTAGAPTFQFTFMDNAATGQADIFAAEIPGSAVTGLAVEYYVRATDSLVPCTEERFWPEPGPEAPAAFTVRAEVLGLPYVESFDGGSGDNPELEDLGWTTVELSFPQAQHSFLLETRGPLSGEYCVGHSEGVPGGFWACPDADPPGPERQNWLISPALDFRTDGALAARFFEREVDGWTCAESHKIWVTTGSPDPEIGPWTLLSDLALPGEAWQASPWFDLSEFVGAEKAWLAFNYQGGAAGRWMIDDFYVGEPLASLELHSALPGGPTLAPGADGVELTVRVRNASAQYDAAALSATLTTADEGLTITTAAAAVPALIAGAEAAVDAPFVFDVAPSHPDNSWLDFALELRDEAGHLWTVPIRVLMGAASSFELDYSLVGGASLSFELGYGPPQAPTFSVGESSGALAGAPWQKDVTDHAAHLPPAGGPDRWFLRVTNDGVADGIVELVSFTVGGQAHDAAGLPATVGPNEELLLFLPERSELSVESYATTPDPAAPGGSVTVTDLRLHNAGYPTSGPVSCVLDSASPAATGFSTTPTFIGGPIGTGEGATATNPFTFDIAASHTANQPIPLVLICLDGADSWAVPFDLPVPFAHPHIVGAVLDDGDGDWDDEDAEVDFADAGDTVDVWLTVENDGAFAFAGPMTATVTLGTGSTALFTLGTTTLDFGAAVLAPGESADASGPLEVAVDPSALLGDRMVLDIQFDDGQDQWTETFVLEASGRPWTDCNSPLDAQGDHGGASVFDIKGCAYRSDGDMLQLRLDAWSPFSTPHLSLWVFFYEVPNQFTLEHVPPGAPDLEVGCVAQDQDVPTTVPVLVENLDDDSVTVRIATGDLGILADNTQVAFGTEYCTGTWWCDVYPDYAVQYSAGSIGCNDFLYVPVFW